jgi:hypothetical protein
MLVAEVRIKGFEGDLSEDIHFFHTDIENLKRGDVVLVFGRYGLELALFENYSLSELHPKGVIIDKVSGKRVKIRVYEQRKLLGLTAKDEFEATVNALNKKFRR